MRRPRPRVARARARFFSRARRRSVSPRGEKDRGDVAERAVLARPRPRSLFSHTRRRSVSPRGEKDRGD
ncbi:hypothetical protein BHM03_00061646, partial [Ensete ventricosum]